MLRGDQPNRDEGAIETFLEYVGYVLRAVVAQENELTVVDVLCYFSETKSNSGRYL